MQSGCSRMRDSAPRRGAGIGGTAEQEAPFMGMRPCSRSWARRSMPILCVSPGSDPQRGPSSTASTRPGFRGCAPASVSGTVVRDGARSRCVADASTCQGRSLLPHPAAHTESQRHRRWRAAADMKASLFPTSLQRPRRCAVRHSKLIVVTGQKSYSLISAVSFTFASQKFIGTFSRSRESEEPDNALRRS